MLIRRCDTVLVTVLLLSGLAGLAVASDYPSVRGLLTTPTTTNEPAVKRSLRQPGGNGGNGGGGSGGHHGSALLHARSSQPRIGLGGSKPHASPPKLTGPLVSPYAAFVNMSTAERKQTSCVLRRGGCLSIYGKMDGFGAQLLAFLSGYAHCEFCGCTYAHTQMRTMYLKAERGKHFDTNMSTTLGPANEVLASLFESLHVPRHERPPVGCVRHDKLHKKNNPHASFVYPTSLSSRLRAAWPMPPPEYYVAGVDHIAVHARRYDIKEGSTFRWQSDQRIEYCIKQVVSRRKSSRPYHIHVFSWNVRPQFSLEHLSFHVDGPDSTLTTFNAFVHAESLIVGMSSFSTSAGLFHADGRVYVPGGTFFPILGFQPPAAWHDC